MTGLARVRTGTGRVGPGRVRPGHVRARGRGWSGASRRRPRNLSRGRRRLETASEILGIRADDFAPTRPGRDGPRRPRRRFPRRGSRARVRQSVTRSASRYARDRWTLKMRVRNRKTISPGYPVSRYGRLGRRGGGTRGWTGRAYPGEDGPSARRHRAQRRRRRRSSSTFRSRRTRRRDGDPPRARLGHLAEIESPRTRLLRPLYGYTEKVLAIRAGSVRLGGVRDSSPRRAPPPDSPDGSGRADERRPGNGDEDGAGGRAWGREGVLSRASFASGD